MALFNKHTGAGPNLTPSNGGVGRSAPAFSQPGAVVKSPVSVGSLPQGRAFHPAFGEELNYRYDVLPEHPDGQVAATIRLMSQYAVEDAGSKEIGAALRACLHGVPDPDHDPYQPIAAIYQWVKRHIRFSPDENISAEFEAQPDDGSGIVEVLIRPRDMVVLCGGVGGVGGSGRQRLGDCDDYSMLLASMLLGAGVATPAFVTVAADPRDPDSYSHVYVVAYVSRPDGTQVRLPLDASHGTGPGWECPNKYGKKKEWPIGAGVTATPMESCLLLAASVAGILMLKGKGK